MARTSLIYYHYGMSLLKVKDLEMMKANGEIIYCSRQSNPEIFKAALLNLGSLGVVLNVTLQCEPAFHLHEYVESATTEEVGVDTCGSTHWFNLHLHLAISFMFVNRRLNTRLGI